MAESDRRLVVVSNRLPIVVRKKDGKWEVGRGSGGLVTAMEPVMAKNRGLWVGWPGVEDKDAPAGAGAAALITLCRSARPALATGDGEARQRGHQLAGTTGVGEPHRREVLVGTQPAAATGVDGGGGRPVRRALRRQPLLQRH